MANPDEQHEPSEDGPHGPSDELVREVNTTAARYRDQLRARRALDLKTRGLTWADVAEHPDCGYYDAKAAYVAVKRLLEHMPMQSAAEYRREALARYERLLAKVWPGAMGLDQHGAPREKGVDMWATDRAMQLVDRIADLSGAKHAPLEEVNPPTQGDPDVAPGAGRSLAALLDLDDSEARQVARVLAPILARRKQHQVIEASDGDSGRIQ
ncbi:hypothetical protein [Actinomycetospora termitidis]|uniref:Helix-turn-helix DNA binding domain protein n=1 Tax=Actinomycetospora termitidis TaxID=3053470 RepID=A0ABT7MFJ5_9PSEU|nr:hypothetical protein [Actinomycetospora sp. Odt1-22]MDL5159438.1 hypothetical protein [Actinomycetospora sp. Odt1-22]